MFERGAARQREHAEAEDLRHQGLPPRRGRVPSGLSRASWPRASRAGLHASTWNAGRHARRRAGRGRARGALLHGGAGRERAHVPDHHDARLRRRARASSRRCSRKLIGKIASRSYDPRFRAVVGEGRHHARHGHDREAGRHRRARQHHAPRRRPATATASPATNGSCRRRCATRSWCWRRRRAGSPVS